MKGYINTDQKLHFLCQTIAKANRSYVPKVPDDSHTNLYFDILTNRIVGRWFKSAKGQLLPSLNLNNLTFEWLNMKKEPVLSVITIGETVSEIENEIDASLGNLGLKRQGFKEPLHFQIPDYPFANEAITNIDFTLIEEWKSFRHLANTLCFLVLGELQVVGEVRIWPHHFDTGLYVEVSDRLGLGFGLAMQDSLVDYPYFYMSGFALQGKLNYERLPVLKAGEWIVNGGWKGSILSLSALSSGSFNDNRPAIIDYLSNSLNWYMGHR